jgi:hypothetical protein
MIRSWRMMWTWHVACIDEVRNACKSLVGKPEWKSLLGTPRNRWEDNVEMV